MDINNLHVLFEEEGPWNIEVALNRDLVDASLHFGLDVRDYPENLKKIDISKYSNNASKIMREQLPEYFWKFSLKTNFIDIREIFSGNNLWWLLPLSEKSALRVPAVNKIFHILILKEVVNDNNIKSLTLYSNDKYIQELIISICKLREISINVKSKSNSSNKYKMLSYIKLNLIRALYFFISWVILRTKYLKSSKKIKNQYQFLLCCLYPSYFEFDLETGREKDTLFGKLSNYFESKNVKYACISQNMYEYKECFSLNIEDLANQNIFIVDGYIKLIDVFKIIFSFLNLWSVFLWNKKTLRENLLLNGINFSKLLINELNHEILAGDTIFNYLIMTYGLSGFISNNANIKHVFYTFEYQSRERAIESAIALIKKNIITYGIQSNTMILNHLNWFFCKDEVENVSHAYRAVLPNKLCVYSDVDYINFSKRVDKDKLYKIGALRHDSLKDESEKKYDIDVFKQENYIPNDLDMFLLALSVSRRESQYLLELVFSSLKNKKIFLLIKFHPLNNMHDKLIAVAKKYKFENYKVFDSGLGMLVNLSTAIIQPGSSVAVYSIALNRMPIIFYEPSSNIPFSIRDYEKSAFFVRNKTELEKAISSCVVKDNHFFEKKSSWQEVISNLLDKNDGKASQRLYDIISR